MITNYPVITRLAVSFLDTLVTILSFVLAAYLRNASLAIYPFGGVIIWSDYLGFLIMIILIWRGLFGYQEAYLGQRYTSFKNEIIVVIKTIFIGSLIILTMAFIVKSIIPRTLIAFFAIVNLIMLSIEKVLLFQFIKHLRKQGKNIKKVLILGTGDVAKIFIDSVKKNADWGLKIIGLICKDAINVGSERYGYQLMGHIAHLRKLLHDNPIDELVIALPARHLYSVEEVMAICDEEGVPVRIISPFFKNLIAKAKTDMVHGLPIIKFSSVERNDFEAAVKRGIDITFALFLSILLFPLFILIALLIKLDSKGPVFYKWKVLGINKRPITSYKFRTMIQNADDLKPELASSNEMNGAAFKMKDDPRITKMGKWLRKFSLDELPQFWSVLRGDLSLVGPRPPLQTEIEKYEGWHRRKLSVKPGITCLWQVSGRNTISDFDEWMRLDMKYIDEWSLWLDCKILLKTPLVALKGTGH